MRIAAPPTAPSQRTASSERAGPGPSRATANGVALPAITRKMLAWSQRCSTPVTRGENRPRW